MEFSQIVKERYATKKFTGESIADDKIEELKEIIKLSASSFGLQPYHVHIITDQATKDKLQEVSWNQPQIGTASHLFVFCATDKIAARIDGYEQMMLDNGADKEKIAPYIGMMRGWLENLPEEKRLPWAQRQVYLAVGNAINGAKSLGFDSCPMEGFDPAAYKEILGLDHMPTVVVPVGIAADEPRPKLRFDIFS